MPHIIDESQLLELLETHKKVRSAHVAVEIKNLDTSKKVPMARTKKGNVIKFWGIDGTNINAGSKLLHGDYTKNDYKGKTYINWNRPDPNKAALSPNPSDRGSEPKDSSNAGGGEPAPSPAGAPNPVHNVHSVHNVHPDPALTLTAATVTLAGAYLQAAAPIAGIKNLNLEAVTKRAAEIVKATYDTFKKEAM